MSAPSPSIMSQGFAGGHCYIVDGKRITSTATQLVDKMYHFNSYEVLNRNYESWKAYPDKNYYSMIHNVLNNGGDDEDARQAILDSWIEAKRLGTVLHKQIEDVLNGQVLVVQPILPEMSQFNNFISWAGDQNLTMVQAEFCVAFRGNKDWTSAGQIDALFKDTDGKYYLIEWTRTSTIKISKVSLQTSIYREMLLSSKGIDVEDRMFVCAFHSDIQNFIWRKCKDRRADALKLLNSV